jgi:hypothetical protein
MMLNAKAGVIFEDRGMNTQPAVGDRGAGVEVVA